MTDRPRFKKIKKDYQAKNLHNPFFHRRPKGKNRRSLKGLLLLIIVLLLFGIWFFLAAPLWRLKNIEVSGLTRWPDQGLKDIVWQQTSKSSWLLFHQSNLFLFDREEAVAKILVDFNFSGVEIRKSLPRTLKIRVEERNLSFVFQQGNDLFYSSSDGYIIREVAVAEADKAKYLLLENKSDDNLLGPDNRIALAGNQLVFLLELRDRLAAYSELALEKFIVTDELNTINVKFLNGPTVYFNPNLSASDQIDRLLLVKKGKIKDNFSKVNYIDLRYGDRIFINPELP